MNRSKLLVVGAALLALAAGPALANTIGVVGPLAPTPGDGLGGTDHSLRAIPGGSATKAFVESDHPTAEIVFTAEFRLLANTALRDDLDLTKVLTLSSGFGNTVPARNLRFGIQRANNNPNNFRFWAYARNNDTGKMFPYVSANFTPDSDNLFRVEWTAASGPGADDGIIRVYRNGTLRAERTDVPSDGQDVERIRFGIPEGSVNTGTSGTGALFLDEITLSRVLSP